MAEDNKNHSRNCKFACPNPSCNRGMSIKGMDHAAYHWDEQQQELVQRFYVTCPCAKKLMCITNTMEKPQMRRKSTKSLSIRSATRLIDFSQIKISEPIGSTA